MIYIGKIFKYTQLEKLKTLWASLHTNNPEPFPDVWKDWDDDCPNLSELTCSWGTLSVKINGKKKQFEIMGNDSPQLQELTGTESIVVGCEINPLKNKAGQYDYREINAVSAEIIKIMPKATVIPISDFY